MAEKPLAQAKEPTAIRRVFDPAPARGIQLRRPATFMNGLLPIAEPVNPSPGYSLAMGGISRLAGSSSIIEMMEIVPEIFHDVRAIDLLTDDARPGFSRQVRGIVSQGKAVSSVNPVGDDDSGLLEGCHASNIVIRRRPKHERGRGILSDSLMVLSKGELRVRDGATEDELKLIMAGIGNIFSSALTCRIGALTLLPNTAMFEQEMMAAEAEFRQSGREFTLILADIDNLKSINTEFGYSAGDFALACVADLLRNEMAKMGYKGSVIFRPGKSKFLHGLRNEDEAGSSPFFKHDEFALVLREPSAAALPIVQKLRAALSDKTFQLGMPHIELLDVRCSFGLCGSWEFTAGAGKLWHQMLDRCVILLQQAKEGGRDRISIG
jgi:GGDEF domain-containing protein